MTEIMLRVNGQNQSVAVDDPNTPLLYAFHDDLGLCGPKFGCGLGQCGACCVIIEGRLNLAPPLVRAALRLSDRSVRGLRGRRPFARDARSQPWTRQ
jgi:aerobic-type carbon monoxide dehydrogenase small subunit (CoxS/CutS family)